MFILELSLEKGWKSMNGVGVVGNVVDVVARECEKDGHLFLIVS